MRQLILEWWIPAFLLFFLSGVLSGYLGSVIQAWYNAGRISSLEFQVNILEANLIREVKTRAALSKGKGSKDDELLEKLTVQTPVVENVQAWYQKFQPRIGG